jgi:aspartate kinase
VRTVEKTAGMRRHRDAMSSVSVTCFGAVASDLPHRALQILDKQNIQAAKYILSPHSITLLVSPDQREAAVKALHALV